jgi:2,3-bisphosphoglycerate-dependent phosphoglycerate mutase
MEKKKENYLILLRHGESMWNQANLFTGWVDLPLSKKGIDEAFEAGRALAKFDIDIVFCSSLIRAIMTAMIALSEHPAKKTPIIQHKYGKQKEWATIYSEISKKASLPVFCDEALNERMYGALQGLNKKETADKFGADVVHQWRRGYTDRPPEGESLELTLERTLPYFQSIIEPQVREGKTVLISAHGNSLRAIIKHLENLDGDTIAKRELATGVPITYLVKDGEYIKVE